MGLFNYEAKSAAGLVTRGVVEAENSSAVAARLRRDGLFPLAIAETRPQGSARERKIPPADVTSFTRQLSDLLSSGFTLGAALSTLAGQARTPAVAALITEIRQGIEKGAELSKVLAGYPAMFSGFYVSMVKIGESGGTLEDSLRRLAGFKEREEEFLGQLRSALMYPAFLLAAGLISIMVLTAFFIPRLAKLFSDFEQVLPVSTRIIIFTGELLGRFWWAFVLGCAACVWAARSFLARERNRLALDALLLRVPLLNRLLIRMEAARFSYALGMLLQSGIPILEGLNIAGLNVSNRKIRLVTASFYEKIRKGGSLSSCVRDEKQYFPEILYRMTAVGEESGDLSGMLLKAAGVFENEVNRTLKSFLALIEPCLVLFIGGIMVVIVFSILLPVFQLDFFPK